MKLLWNHLADLFHRQRRTEGTLSATLMLVGAVRVLLRPGRHLELLRLEIFEKYVIGADDRDSLFPLSHRHYLATGLTHRERLDCALSHYRYEEDRYDSRYKEAVYHASGIALWSRTVDAVPYALLLRATTDLRHEGGISVVLCAGSVVLCEMSFAWVPADVIGAGGSETIPLVTRNQSIRRDAPELAAFRRAFPQNSPPYFCLAAVHGLVQAHGIGRLAGIRHERQVAFEERHAASFHNSYCRFWQSFDAVSAGPVALLMAVPPAIPPIQSVQAKHRKRAIGRRRQWSDIAQQAHAALTPHLRQTAAPVRAAGLQPPVLAMLPLQAGLLLLSSFAG